MAHSALQYDPTRRYNFKVEDVEYRRDSDQSWLAMVYQPQGMVEKVAELYRAAGGDVELGLFQGMPHGIAGWTASEVQNMIERTKRFIAQHLAAAVAREGSG